MNVDYTAAISVSSCILIKQGNNFGSIASGIMALNGLLFIYGSNE
jgi:hypothetical protein